MTVNRFARLFQSISDAGLDGVALNPGPSLMYLTGLNFHLMERPTVVLAVLPDRIAIIMPRLEAAKLAQMTGSITDFQYGDNPAEWPGVFKSACDSMGLNGKKIGVEPNRLRFLELNYLQLAAPKTHFLSAGSIFDVLRLQKDAGEIALMRQAVKIAQSALVNTIPLAKVGMTERELAAELTIQMLRKGSDPEMPFAPIVSSGPNSANPHASPSDRKLSPGDLLVVDWGAYYRGYVSDLTRTFAIGEVAPEYQHIAKIVAEANAAGRAACRPGIAAGDVDRAARAVIEKSGYGIYFTHRTGHGIGMEGHEPPYMFAENDLILAEGMAFTVEPGIYLPGRNGVRIEDNMVITAQGADSLSDLPRELSVIA